MHRCKLEIVPFSNSLRYIILLTIYLLLITNFLNYVVRRATIKNKALGNFEA